MKIVCNLPVIRAEAGRLSLTELSKQTGIALSTLSRIDSGKSGRLDLDTLLTLCKYFRRHPGDFFKIVFEPGDESFSELDVA